MYMNCPVCWSTVKAGQGRVRLLAMRTCGHVVCTDCLAQIRAQSVDTACHTCRKRFRANDLVEVQLRWGLLSYSPDLFGNLIRATTEKCLEESLNIQDHIQRVNAIKQRIVEENLEQSDDIENHQDMLLDLRRRAKLLESETTDMWGEARNEISRIAAATQNLHALTAVDAASTTDKGIKDGGPDGTTGCATSFHEAVQLVCFMVCLLAWLLARLYFCESRAE